MRRELLLPLLLSIPPYKPLPPLSPVLPPPASPSSLATPLSSSLAHPKHCLGPIAAIKFIQLFQECRGIAHVHTSVLRNSDYSVRGLRFRDVRTLVGRLGP